MTKNYYDILGVRPDASLEEIKHAYRKLALKWHPDRNRGRDTAARFRLIQEAYVCLHDSSRRAAHDWTLRNAARRAADPPEEPGEEAGEKTSRRSTQPPPWRFDCLAWLRRARAAHVLKNQTVYALFGSAVAALVFSGWLYPSDASRMPEAQQKQSAANIDLSPVQASPLPPEEQAEALDRATQEALHARFERGQLAELLRRESAAHEAATAQSRAENESLRTELNRARSQLGDAQTRLEALERRENEQARLPRAETWITMSTQLFGAPYLGGSPCDLPLLQDARCSEIRSNVPESLAFTLGDPRIRTASHMRMHVTLSRWTLEIVGSAIPYEPWPWRIAAGLTGSRIIGKLGFSPQMIRMCEQEGQRRIEIGAVSYTCSSMPREQDQPPRFVFTARLIPHSTAACHHPLCQAP